MFCIECGKEAELYDNLCEECYRSKNVFVKAPAVIDMVLCAHCSALNLKSHWMKVSSMEDALESVIQNAIELHEDATNLRLSFDIEYEDSRNIRADFTAYVTARGLEVQESHTMRVRVKHTTCGRCSRIAGDYYEAILQVRAEGRALEKAELERVSKEVYGMLEKLQRSTAEAFVSKEVQTHGGLDFYIGSMNVGRSIAKKLAESFGTSVTESSKLVGRREGRNLYRVTYAVRIPPYAPGDIIELDGSVMRIQSIMHTKVIALELATGMRKTFPQEHMKHAKVLGGTELIREAVVVSESRKELQILDPDTYKTVELVKPRGFKVTGDTVRIIKWDGINLLID